jgi:allantoate deiminase
VAADAATVLRRCDELGAVSETPGELTRRFATRALADAGTRVRAWMTGAGLQTRVDAVGNVIGRLEAGDGRRTLLVGSHLDTVRNAGRYDGPLGVLAGIALAERFSGAEPLPFALEVVGFADEEGLRYGTPYLGSRTLAGSFRPEDLDRVDPDGISMRDAIGGDLAAIEAEARRTGDLVGYVELHIEQGPVLEAGDHQVGVVSAIAGRTRARLELIGRAGHAGTVPMALRHDPLVVAARIVERVDTIARSAPGVVATVGELIVEPGAANVIPGRVTLTIDVRAPDDDVRLEAWETIADRINRLAQEGGIEARALELEHTPAVACDARLRALLTAAARARGIDAPSLTSGAGHDGVIVSAIAPVAMLFVRSPGGLSHHPDESVREGDVTVALDVLEEFVRALALSEAPR